MVVLPTWGPMAVQGMWAGCRDPSGDALEVGNRVAEASSIADSATPLFFVGLDLDCVGLRPVSAALSRGGLA